MALTAVSLKMNNVSIKDNYGSQVLVIKGTNVNQTSLSKVEMSQITLQDNGNYASNTTWSEFSVLKYLVDNNFISALYVPSTDYEVTTKLTCNA
jgi:hypothetical protein